ncbi:hypothetical protein [Streptomyces sp. NPDC093094]|uniref:hypothetical protein n=1 Tax=Streptomyces sp. NPDC093094 TaxID=3366026 RepID=UPI0038172F4D
MDSVHHPAPHTPSPPPYPAPARTPEYADPRSARRPAERRAIRRFLIANIAASALILAATVTGAAWLAAPAPGGLPLGMVLLTVQGGVFLATAWRFERHGRTAPEGGEFAGPVPGSEL